MVLCSLNVVSLNPKISSKKQKIGSHTVKRKFSQDQNRLKEQYFSKLVLTQGGRNIFIGENSKGRGIFANIDLPQNFLITQEKPFVSIPTFEWNNKIPFCHHCLTPITKLNASITKCQHCHEAYCSKKCQNDAWNEYHVRKDFGNFYFYFF